jgi:hypothetical protein
MADTTATKTKNTTTFDDLVKRLPQSETHWHAISARAHRLINMTGSEAAARTHETLIWEIRQGRNGGSTREIRFCPRCLDRGMKYILLFMGGQDRCGTCGWPATTI